MSDDLLFGRKRKRSRWLGTALSAGLGAGTLAAGSALGHPAIAAALAPHARNFGTFAGDVIKTFTGFGAYNVASNALYEGAQAPFVRNSDLSGGLVVTHREYVCDVITSSTLGAFSLQTFFINPGLPQLWEFLPQIACNYEEYIIEGMLLTYKPTSADATNSTNIALGTVVMATQYNPTLPDYESKAEMMSAEYCTSCKPSEGMIHPIECDMSKTPQNMLYVRTGTIPTNTDQRLWDFAKVSIATSGFQGGSVVCGELWVSYQFALLKPRLYAALGYYTDWLNISATSGFSTSHILGAYTYSSSSNVQMDFTESLNTFTVTTPAYPQPITYFVVIKVVLVVAAALNPIFTSIANVAGTPVGGSTSPEAGVSSLYHTKTFAVHCYGNCVASQFSLSHTEGANMASTSFHMIQIPNNAN